MKHDLWSVDGYLSGQEIPCFIEIKNRVLRSQILATGPYPETIQTISHSYNLFMQYTF